MVSTRWKTIRQKFPPTNVWGLTQGGMVSSIKLCGRHKHGGERARAPSAADHPLNLLVGALQIDIDNHGLKELPSQHAPAHYGILGGCTRALLDQPKTLAEFHTG